MSRCAILACGFLFVAALANAAPAEEEAQPLETPGKPRFLDDLFAELANIKGDSISNQGGTIIQKVQSIQGSGASQIIKTEITQTSSFGPRYKRGILDRIEGLTDRIKDKVGKVKDRLTGAADTYNKAVEVGHKLKGKL